MEEWPEDLRPYAADGLAWRTTWADEYPTLEDMREAARRLRERGDGRVLRLDAAWLLCMGCTLGDPRLHFRPGWSIAAGGRYWETFAATASLENLGLAKAALLTGWAEGVWSISPGEVCA